MAQQLAGQIWSVATKYQPRKLWDSHYKLLKTEKKKMTQFFWQDKNHNKEIFHPAQRTFLQFPSHLQCLPSGNLSAAPHPAARADRYRQRRAQDDYGALDFGSAYLCLLLYCGKTFPLHFTHTLWRDGCCSSFVLITGGWVDERKGGTGRMGQKGLGYVVLPLQAEGVRALACLFSTAIQCCIGRYLGFQAKLGLVFCPLPPRPS